VNTIKTGVPATAMFPRSMAAAAFAATLVLAGCGGGGGGGNSSGGTPSPAYVDPTLYSTAAGASLAQPTEVSAVTQHQIVVGGSTLAYTATAGHLTVSNPQSGAPEASFFYVAYTLNNQAAATRPVTFFYNGGPGSATVWLHLGSFGPRRLETGIPAATEPMPFPLVDNADSLLDVSDLVFVDAVGTGLSEAIAPQTNQSFWGVDVDALVFRDFVLRYLAANQRTVSPTFLFGESYGTTRSAVLASVLETAGVHINGVVLQSSILNYNTNCGVIPDTLVSCAGYIPTYGAVGAYYDLDVPTPPDAMLPAYEAQMRAFTVSSYDPAFTALISMEVAPSAALLAQLANLTGLPAAVWQFQFNLDPGIYQTKLRPGILLGLYDARVSAPVGSALAADGDPSSTYITPSFVAGIGTYLSTELQYTNPSPYTALSNAINTWNFAHDGQALPDVIPDLATAFAQNPQLQVLSLNGYHDMVTPFFQTETDLLRLGTNPNLQKTFYRGGHMTYLDDGSRPLEKADLVQFYQRATAPPQ
jgi:carboxypeptidase C (cathepsin A)